MATPFSHASVSYVSKTGRRRSQSVTLPNEFEADAPEKRKQIFVQLQKERQKQQNNRHEYQNEQFEDLEEQEHDKEDYQSVSTRVPGGNNTQSAKNHTSSFVIKSVPLKKQRSLTNRRNSTAHDDEQHRWSVTRVKRSVNTTSMKKNTSSMETMSSTLYQEIPSITSNGQRSEENEQQHGNQPHVVRIPRSESTKLFTKQMSTRSIKNSNFNAFTTLKNPNFDTSATLKGIYLEPSQVSSNLLVSSSTNLMSKSEIFDQEFHLDDSKDHARRNDAKRHGQINISGQGQHYDTYDRRLSARSSAAFMAAIIGIVIAIIAFAFGLTSLILVLLLRSTVNTALGTNSTSSNSSSISIDDWSSGCWNYTTLDDPTRNVNAAGYALGCDNTAPFISRTSPVWIRFIGTGGTTLPLTTPGINMCGSVGTGWYDGVMPSIAGQLVNGTACFTWYTSVCQYSQSISLANCGSYYVYLLPPAPACMMRYCTI